MRKFTFKSLLLVAGLLMGTSAWAADKTVVKYSFNDAANPALTAGSRTTLDYTHISVATNTVFLNATNNNNGQSGQTNVPLTSMDLTGETWTLVFEWAGNGGCNSKTGHTILKAGDTNLFDIEDVSNWNTTVTLKYGTDGSATIPVPGCNKSNRFSINTAKDYNKDDYWHHFVITGSAEGGVKMTVVNSKTGDAIVTDVVLSATNVTPTAISLQPSCGGAVGIDELSLSYFVEGEVVQTPSAEISSVDGIWRNVRATCDTQGADIYYSVGSQDNWQKGDYVSVDEETTIYFKAVKGTTESEILEFPVKAGFEIQLNAPVISRPTDGTVKITVDQASVLLSPSCTLTYTYNGQTTSVSIYSSPTDVEIPVTTAGTITAYAKSSGYADSEETSLEVARFPNNVETIENAAAKTSGWSANAFSEETKTVSERTYAALLLDETQWGKNVYLQTNGAWGLRANGNWYINDDKTESWLLIPNMKKDDIIVVEVTYPASSMVNATYSKYSYGNRQTYEVTEDGDVELAFKKINASTMDYFYGVYAYRTVSSVTKEITTAGYATYCSPYYLDFSAVEGLTAYIAKAVDGKVTFEVVKSVPAKTGVLLKGAAKTYEIPVVTSADTRADNVFKGVLADTEVEAGAFVLANGAQGVGFYKTTAEKFTVGANTAYLPASIAPAEEPAEVRFIAIEDVATGIKNVNVNANFNGEVYNLNGQRVNKAQKGLYIVNGKKFINK